MMVESCGYDEDIDLKELDGTVRWFSRYYWKDASGKDFDVPYKTHGLHINSKKFSQWVIKKLQERNSNYSVIEDHITEIKQTSRNVFVKGNNTYTFDFIIDCRGTPELTDEYAVPEFVGVNSAILFPDFKNYDEEFTSAYFHKNGWMFGVPLSTRKTFGYLYNSSITTDDEAKLDFSQKYNIENYRFIKWKQYYRKKAIDNRVLYMGNKLYLFEPHQAIPLHYYITLTGELLDSIRECDNIRQINTRVNNYHTKNIEEIQDLIALNYQGTCKSPSPFWDYAMKSSESRLKKSNKFLKWVDTTSTTQWDGYWEHSYHLMKEYCEGFNIDLTKFKK
jgi:hypothetical protein